MAEEKYSQLHFSIEESVWLKRGQEVEEVLSISLVPDVAVQEFSDYAAVKGTLLLSGEIVERKQSSPDSAEDDFPDPDYYRSIQEISRSEDGTTEIMHRFPIDITIPLNRVRSLDELLVTVHSFDYTLPERNCLRLNADIAISGIWSEQKSEETTPEPEETAGSERAETGTWEAVVKLESEPEESEKEPLDAEPGSIWTGKEAAASFTAEEFSLQDSAPADYLEEDAENAETESQTPIRSDQPAESAEEKHEEPEEAVHEEAEYEKSGSRPGNYEEENALYLTKMLTKEEENFAKMKLCIIQPGDSLDEIAQRYRILPSHLARTNQPEEEEVREGQLLYIPVNK